MDYHGPKRRFKAAGGQMIPYATCIRLILLLGFVFHVTVCLSAKGFAEDRGPEDKGAVSSSGETAGPEHKTNRLGTMEGEMTRKARYSEEEGRQLLRLARKTIEQHLRGAGSGDEAGGDPPPGFTEWCGTFVTLTKGGRLRGCIGHILPQGPLFEGVKVNAINAAFRDPRFRPLQADEMAQVKIEVSILSEPLPLRYKGKEDLLNQLKPGVDGLIIKKGYHQATFLPQVWEQLPQKEAFLSQLCLKAGLDGDAWEKGDLEVSVYQVQAFEE
jgi:AmmeMemoRadiSam system protein A